LIIGIYFLFIGSLAIAVSIYEGNFSSIFWICYLGLILSGLGILLKRVDILESQLNILLIPLLVWNIDFYATLFWGISPFGVTDYFFIGTFSISKFVSLQHLTTIPLGIFALYLFQYKKRSALKVSFIQIILIFICPELFFMQTPYFSS